jgi:hypothetical protein
VKAFAIYIRYIGLPLCGGLILTLYLYILDGKHLKERTPLTEKAVVKNPPPTPFTLLEDVTTIFIPSLKKHDAV